MQKKKVLFHSNNCKAKTGFGRNAKEVLKYLYSTGKYEIIEYCTGIVHSHPTLKKRPWKAYGALPDNKQEWEEIQKNPSRSYAVQYGDLYIDELIKKEKPDVYIGVEDIWAFNGYDKKKWWNKINCVIHTTLDSLPIIALAKDMAPNIKNYYVWADFAKEAMHEEGFKHVDVVNGAINSDDFYPLSKTDKQKIREVNNIPQDALVIGFVFRNQLRKSLPNLLDAFKIYQEKNPNTYLLLHTCWSENPSSSWNIPKLIEERGLKNENILTTYICNKCGSYEVKPFTGESLNCKSCHSEKSLNTSSVTYGVTEKQLNEIYNIMDCLVHPFTSGGLEIPLIEARLSGVPCANTNYSCGTTYTTKEAAGFPLSWRPYYEPGSQFIKATTLVDSIVEFLNKFKKLSEKEIENISNRGRKFALENYSTDVVGKRWEEIIDNLPDVEWDFDFSEKPKNPNYIPSDNPSDIEWLKEIYKNILLLDVQDTDKGLNYWLEQIKNGATRENILLYFKDQALKDNSSNNKIQFEDLLDHDDEGKRLAIVIPESAGDVLMVTSLLENLSKVYPEYNIYFITKQNFFPIVEGNPYIHKVIPYIKECENLLWMEGQGRHKGLFEICFLPHVGTQRVLNYLHNGKDRIQFEIKG